MPDATTTIADIGLKTSQSYAQSQQVSEDFRLTQTRAVEKDTVVYQLDTFQGSTTHPSFAVGHHQRLSFLPRPERFNAHRANIFAWGIAPTMGDTRVLEGYLAQAQADCPADATFPYSGKDAAPIQQKDAFLAGLESVIAIDAECNLIRSQMGQFAKG